MGSRRLLPWLLLFVMVGIFLINAAGVFYSWYFTFPWFDSALHFIGGAWSALFVLYLFQTNRLKPWNNFKKTYLQTFLIVLSLVALVGIWWEFFEFSLDWFAIENNPPYLNQPSVADTMTDFFFDLLGGAVVILLSVALAL